MFGNALAAEKPVTVAAMRDSFAQRVIETTGMSNIRHVG
jgi:hypothetical protein